MSAQGAAATEAEGLETQREEITTAKGEEHIITLYTSFHSDYCNYTWESARVLAWHLAVSELNGLKGKRVLEMGCGTALPGLLAARCGASVTLTDAHTAQGALDRAWYFTAGRGSHTRTSAFVSQEMASNGGRRSKETVPCTSLRLVLVLVRLAAAANGVEDRVTTLPWTWGEWTAELLSLPTPDLIIASDCLYARSG